MDSNALEAEIVYLRERVGELESALEESREHAEREETENGQLRDEREELLKQLQKAQKEIAFLKEWVCFRNAAGVFAPCDVRVLSERKGDKMVGIKDGELKTGEE
jgi:hypothetical protein